MSKDERPATLIEEFNRSHRRIKREEKDWYVPYLPRGLGMEDITEKEDRILMSIFTTVEEEVELQFDDIVRDRFNGYFDSLSLTDILEFLPQKPNLVLLEEMKTEDRNAIKELYYDAVESGYIKKTIRKQIRRYLDETGYLKKRMKEIDTSAATEKKKERKAPKSKVSKKKLDIDLTVYLPQKPNHVDAEELKKDDLEMVEDICRSGIEAGFIKKTIRKQIRRLLQEKGYFDKKKKAENKVSKKGGKKGEKKVGKKEVQKVEKKVEKKDGKGEKKVSKKVEKKAEKKDVKKSGKEVDKKETELVYPEDILRVIDFQGHIQDHLLDLTGVCSSCAAHASNSMGLFLTRIAVPHTYFNVHV